MRPMIHSEKHMVQIPIATVVAGVIAPNTIVSVVDIATVGATGTCKKIWGYQTTWTQL